MEKAKGQTQQKMMKPAGDMPMRAALSVLSLALVGLLVGCQKPDTAPQTNPTSGSTVIETIEIELNKIKDTCVSQVRAQTQGPENVENQVTITCKKNMALSQAFNAKKTFNTLKASIEISKTNLSASPSQVNLINAYEKAFTEKTQELEITISALLKTPKENLLREERLRLGSLGCKVVDGIEDENSSAKAKVECEERKTVEETEPQVRSLETLIKLLSDPSQEEGILIDQSSVDLIRLAENAMKTAEARMRQLKAKTIKLLPEIRHQLKTNYDISIVGVRDTQEANPATQTDTQIEAKPTSDRTFDPIMHDNVYSFVKALETLTRSADAEQVLQKKEPRKIVLCCRSQDKNCADYTADNTLIRSCNSTPTEHITTIRDFLTTEPKN